MLWVDERQLDMAVQWLHAAAAHCRNVDGMLVIGAEAHRVKAQVLGALTALHNGPVVVEHTTFIAPTGPRSPDDPVTLATWPPAKRSNVPPLA